jgi:hypothetical protein
VKLHQSLTIIFFLFALTQTRSAFGAGSNETFVEVQTGQDVLAPYSERRDPNGIMIGLDYEAIIFKSFVSTYDGSTYDILFGSGVIPLVHLSLDYKRNFVLGSIALGFDYGAGTVSGASGSSLEVTKYGGSVKYIADNLSKEPIVAPYVGLNIWKIKTVDDAITTQITQTTDVGFNYTVGVLLQLNWIDLHTSRMAAINYGLENTYLNLYATQYLNTASDTDIKTETDMTFGAGVKLEF